MFIRKTEYERLKRTEEYYEWLKKSLSAYKYAEEVICAWCGSQGCAGLSEGCVQHFFKQNGILLK